MVTNVKACPVKGLSFCRVVSNQWQAFVEACPVEGLSFCRVMSNQHQALVEACPEVEEGKRCLLWLNQPEASTAVSGPITEEHLWRTNYTKARRARHGLLAKNQEACMHAAHDRREIQMLIHVS